ncbi:alpha/beta hydrolase fold domain-containing protein [Streptomonospora litoralis]|uniref:Monoterpene epsilon-lactone hydrolase n=1 Tax=Streptomonospora litoralis TaxID=2498135 RepID=A0A4P6Q5G1_9ACTN|nr:alpha/beta hydrolase [Streptomonospora litoralis]QBI54124.1 Monoterpene epsilon-lactone hydrolase [Streptomonospora litoralis]
MDLDRIPADPGTEAALAAYMARVSGPGTPPELPGDADLAPALPGTGGLPGVWVSAQGAAPATDGVVMFVHGGGFADRRPRLVDLVAHRFSRAAALPVFAVHYRLAPHAPYPAPLEDVLAAYRGILASGVPAERVVVLGESSGGALALSALLALRDSGTPPPACAITFSAVTDMTVSGPSAAANAATDPGVDRTLLTRLVGGYLGGARPDRAPQSPLHGSLHGLPPLLMGVGGAEVLLDDTLRFAEKAAAAGSGVAVDVYEAMPHAFHIAVLDDTSPTGARVLRRAAGWIALRLDEAARGPGAAGSRG